VIHQNRISALILPLLGFLPPPPQLPPAGSRTVPSLDIQNTIAFVEVGYLCSLSTKRLVRPTPCCRCQTFCYCFRVYMYLTFPHVFAAAASEFCRRRCTAARPLGLMCIQKCALFPHYSCIDNAIYFLPAGKISHMIGVLVLRILLARGGSAKMMLMITLRRVAAAQRVFLRN
jgi:hypothetical protein